MLDADYVSMASSHNEEMPTWWLVGEPYQLTKKPTSFIKGNGDVAAPKERRQGPTNHPQSRTGYAEHPRYPPEMWAHTCRMPTTSAQHPLITRRRRHGGWLGSLINYLRNQPPFIKGGGDI